jgi:hypothetical protein
MPFASKSSRSRRPQPRRACLQLEALESRLVPYTVSGNAWPHPNLITLSFVPDGTILGSSPSGYIRSNLFATFNNHGGWNTSTWQNQILKAAQVWAQQTNVNFAVVPDDGASEGSGNYQQGDPGHGDIRISGYNLGTNALAQAYMPPSVNNYSIAGDIQFNTAQPFNIGSTYDLFTVAVHEFGHALGLYGSSTISAAMYETYSGVKTGLCCDDIAGIQSIYSNNQPRTPDAYNTTSSNGSFCTAADLTRGINSSSLTALVTGLDITTTSTREYFTFTAPQGTTGNLTLTVQSSGLSLLAPTVTVYAADQRTVLGSSSGYQKYGTTLTVTIKNVTAGQQLYVKVAGADTTAFGTGAYALTLNFGTSPSPTVPLPNTQTLDGSPLTAGGGEPVKQMYESLVNTTTADVQQTFPQSPQAVAMNANGNYVVTWSSHNQDGSGWGVYAQRFNASGVPQGGEFLVNTFTQDDQMYFSVAMDPAGDFVITWSSHNQDGGGWGVYAQRYSASGVPQGGEFCVNTTTQDDQMYSSVAMDSAGNFVITWSSHNQDGNGWGVYAQRFSNTGVALGGEFRVNTTTKGDKEYSSVAMDGAGDFVITWSSNGQDGNGWGVYAQRYSASGVAQGGEFLVNTTTQDNQMYSTVAMDGAGDFVITWSSHNQDGGGWGIYAQRYNASGVPQGGEFLVNVTTAGDQEYSRIAMDAYGNFYITWSSNGQDGGGWGVFGRQFNAAGAALGGEFQVNTTTAGDQNNSAIAMDGLGDVVAVWSGNGSADNAGVFAQRYNVTSNALSLGNGDTFSLTEDDALANPDSGSSPAKPSGKAAPASVQRGDLTLVVPVWDNDLMLPWATPGRSPGAPTGPVGSRTSGLDLPVPAPAASHSPILQRAGRFQAPVEDHSREFAPQARDSDQDQPPSAPAESDPGLNEPNQLPQSQPVSESSQLREQWERVTARCFSAAEGLFEGSTDYAVDLCSLTPPAAATDQLDQLAVIGALAALWSGTWTQEKPPFDAAPTAGHSPQRTRARGRPGPKR